MFHYHGAMPEPTTLLEDALDVPAWLEADRHSPLAERTHRDREIGRTIDKASRLNKVRHWWQKIEHGAFDGPGRRVRHVRAWINLGLAALGVATGIGVALAAFRYDGSYPVNVVRLLGLLVAPQLLLLILSLLLLPGRLPGLSAVQDTLRALNPGQWAASLLERAGRPDPNAALAFDWLAARSAAARRLAKWQMLCWSQIAAIGFNAGALATAVALIAFTDLAFGWSTTLNVGTDAATGIAASIAAPWQSLVPGAVPDTALVEQSRYFRLDGGTGLSPGASQDLAAWWSFTLLAIATYGLLPRLVFAILSAARLRAATCALLLEDPRVTALLDRMSAPEIDTRIEHTDRVDGPAHIDVTPAPALEGAAHAVIWSQCTDAASAADIAGRRLGLGLTTIADAGSTLADDQAALAAVTGSAGSVIVFVPAWEPPVLEIMDFLTELRTAIGPSPSIVVLPVGESGAPSTALERETWTRAARRTGDAHLYVEAGAE